MSICEALGIQPGITAVIGSGGKTTLLSLLARELSGSVVLCTTTHILPFANIPTLLDPTLSDLSEALSAAREVCAGNRCDDRKLSACMLTPLQMARVARFVLVEADGARRLPLKAHAPWEPVIPEGTNRTLLVVGAQGLNKPLAEAVHRPERFAELVGCVVNELATPKRVAQVISHERLADTVVVNQADTAPTAARELGDELVHEGFSQVFLASFRDGWSEQV